MIDSLEVRFHARPLEVLAWRQYDQNIDIAVAATNSTNVDCYDVSAGDMACIVHTVSNHDKVPFLPDTVPNPTGYEAVTVLEVSMAST